MSKILFSQSLSFFSKKTSWGLIALFVILGLFVLIKRLIYSTKIEKEVKEAKMYQAEWEMFQNQRENLSNKSRHAVTKNKSTINDDSYQYELFYFDPNTINARDLEKLGLPTRTVKNIINYRKAGGRYKTKEDLKRLYTLKDTDYDRIAPYVRIQSEFVNSKNNKSDAAFEDKVEQMHNTDLEAEKLININTADEAQLKELRGIGPVYAKRIINFREKLGGFYSITQLSEMYNFPDSVYVSIKDKIRVDISQLKKIDVNAASEDILAAHPYIGKSLAQNIVQLRKGLGEFRKIEDLRQTPLINEEKYRKIAPYLMIK